MVLAPLPVLWPLGCCQCLRMPDKTHYRATCMKFSDLWHQVDQTRQSDYAFCEPPKRDGLDPPMKKACQGPPLLLEQRSCHQHFQTEIKVNLSVTALKVDHIIFSQTVRIRKQLGISVLCNSAGSTEWRSWEFVTWNLDMNQQRWDTPLGRVPLN